jgi:uncharacterized membrane protein
MWSLAVVASVWLALVWLGPINASTLGFSQTPDAPLPSNFELRKAVLMLASNADLIWIFVALVNLHVGVMRVSGLATARAWLGLAAGSAAFIGLLNMRTQIPLGGMSFGDGLGAKFLGVAVGWPLFWGMLMIAAREAVIWARPRISHAAASFGAAVVALVTIANLEPGARHMRGWWDWFIDLPRNPSGVHPSAWATCFLWPWLMLFLMRENDVVSGATPRTARPAILLGVLNAVALIARFR